MGVLRAKAVPAARIESFATSGMGASPSWAVLCADKHVAFTPEIGVVGDVRLVADLPPPGCWTTASRWPRRTCAPRTATVPVVLADVARRAERRLSDDGIQTLAGYEMEFVLTDLSGNRLGERGWPAYGLGVLSELSSFTTEVAQAFAAAGCPAEQLHAEYGTGQFELSLPPAPPVVAADAVLLARSVVFPGRAVGTGCGVHPRPSPFRTVPATAGTCPCPSPLPAARCCPAARSAGLTETGAQLIAGLPSTGWSKPSRCWPVRPCRRTGCNPVRGPAPTAAGGWRTGRRPCGC